MKTISATLRDWRGLYLLGLLLILPFCTRAYFIDDYYHMLMARGITEHPTRPYDFLAIDAGPGHKGWDPGQKPRMVNPPLFHYVMALPMALGLDATWVLRLYAGILSWAAVFFLWNLAKEWCGQPQAAAWLAAFSPAFFLTSYSLLIDGFMVVFFLGGLWAFIKQWQKESWAWPFFSGLLMALATLTKYTAFLIVPVTLLWWLLFRRKLQDGLKLLATFGTLFFFQWVWAQWNIGSYGLPHLFSASERVVSTDVASWGKLIVIGTFFSGSFIFPLFSFALPIRHGPGKSLAVVLVALCTAMAWGLSTPKGGFTGWQAGLIGIFFLAALWFLIFLGFERSRAGAKEDIFLFLWLLGGLVMMALVMGWVASRYFLVVLLPAVCLWVRHVETWEPKLARAVLAAGLILVGLANLSLAYTDWRQAQVYRKVAQDLEVFASLSPKGRYFLGDSFVGYTPYLEARGWHAAFPGDRLPLGALLLRNVYTAPSWWSTPGTDGHELVGKLEYGSRFPLRVMDLPASAGFYASAWGALPFSFSRRPWERFSVYRVSHDTSGGNND